MPRLCLPIVDIDLTVVKTALAAIQPRQGGWTERAKGREGAGQENLANKKRVLKANGATMQPGESALPKRTFSFAASIEFHIFVSSSYLRIGLKERASTT